MTLAVLTRFVRPKCLTQMERRGRRGGSLLLVPADYTNYLIITPFAKGDLIPQFLAHVTRSGRTDTLHFATKDGETVELLCGLDHDFEGWPQRIRVRDVNSGAVTVIVTNDLSPLKREQCKALALPDGKDGS
jgi:hypothetical protein